MIKLIEPAQGARTDIGTVQTRSSAATDAGLSERQRKTALRVASIPKADRIACRPVRLIPVLPAMRYRAGMPADPFIPVPFDPTAAAVRWMREPEFADAYAELADEFDALRARLATEHGVPAVSADSAPP
ncbi:MAG TPA: hypothetical protein PKZ76_00945 [Xanthomonadaceae bacterium]|nr:hypothetical protein [Xanthomonadaceae bacterium]